MSDSLQITRRAKSNLAFALRILPRERRADAVVFYAFCRTLDDLADAPGISANDRAAGLKAWKQGLLVGFQAPNALELEVSELRKRHQIPTEYLTAIIDGCEMDLDPQRFQTWDELKGYIWKVACAVGLVSTRIFGCKNPAADAYAISLGRALQLTNILRDIREDYENGQRIYLPIEDLTRFDYRETDLAAGVCDSRFVALMEFQAGRAESFFQEAERILPADDYQALAPARVMSAIYRQLLAQMQQDGFRVFEKRYRISDIRKLAILTKHWIAKKG